MLSNQKATWYLALAALVIILAGIGLRQPWPADEPRFAQVAVEMVESGQWFFPSRGGELYPDKPPVFMWAIAAFYALLGSIKWAFLLPSALSGLLTLFLVYDLGKRLWDKPTGLIASTALLISLQFTLQAKTAQIDAMLCVWVTLGCYGLLRQLLLRDGWHWYFIGCAAMGVGMLTKGVGFLPLLMLLPYFLLRWFTPQTDELKGAWRFAMGPLLMCLVVGFWLVPMLLLVSNSGDPAYALYRDNILFKQTVKRYAESWHHIKPFWYYLVSVIPVFWLPLSLLLPWLVPKWWHAIKQQDRRIILPLSFVVLVILFFSISPGKRGVYMLPALPMLALVSAPYIKDILTKAWPNRLIFAVVGLLTLLTGALALMGLTGSEKALRLTEDYPVKPWLFLLCLALAGVVSLWLSRRRLYTSWLYFIPALWLLYSTWGYSLLGPARTPEHVFASMQEILPAQTPVALVSMKEQFLLFSPYPMTHFGYHTAIEDQQAWAWAWLEENPEGRVLVSRQEGLNCFDLDKAIDLGFAHREDWLLLANDARHAACEQPSAAKLYQAKTK
ncbi:glycosyltransferase family 39 protein [Aliiglaciecola sp. CAU 1673]|uniref:ArnT family glycosyltransferase n=1 Tax=Aliiglaciecola sp. CAU 1673 TaxID=3032595 RepID=UPI0023DA3E90|nr:glycosyltransferase family 39 protein [Aliiglaciecola sp. CAU 1673]MDF2177277.1 glycosyltransferase family 39 protein [Aliiglaciecola sp. CAU 1673]